MLFVMSRMDDMDILLNTQIASSKISCQICSTCSENRMLDVFAAGALIAAALHTAQSAFAKSPKLSSNELYVRFKNTQTQL